jgi:sigma-54 specific flagellar transcriptional regulator A
MNSNLHLARMIIGSSFATCKMRDLITSVADYNVAVMAHGPTGAGKELVAEGIHMMSGRKGKLVAVNCAAIPSDLLEAELFGYEKGAFTGAEKRRAGRFEEAKGGTLFLDEIGDMPLELQAKLLRILESRRLQRVGSNEEIPVDFRLVCATHQDIEAQVEERQFRADLLYRINVFPIRVPALVERREDIPALLKFLMLRMESDNLGMQPPNFDQSGLLALQKYSWPGNIRELRNFIERSSVLFKGRQITATEVSSLLSFDAEKEVEQATLWDALDDLQKQSPAINDTSLPPRTSDEIDYLQLLKDSPEFNLKDYMSEIEVALIKSALEQGGGSVPEAAKALGVRRTTLIEKLKKFGMNASAVPSEAAGKMKSKQGVAL